MRMPKGTERMDFNPRSREGSDAPTMGPPPSSWHFNPRSREGSDDKTQRALRIPWHFNPRSREGSDSPSADQEERIDGFQSTLP